MLRYIARRLVFILLTLWLTVTLTFLIMHAVPGDPFIGESRIPEQVLANLRAYYGLDQPLTAQYVKYLSGVLRLDLGPSIKSDTQGVNDMIAQGFPVSAQLGLQALAFALIVGVTLGVLAALYHNRWIDYCSMIIAVLGISVPSFILATVLIHFFAVKLTWFPVATWGTWKHTVLPSLSLAVAPMAYIARLMRSSMLEVLSQDYIQTALAKGLPWPKVVLRHAIRNAILPVVTVLGPIAAAVLTGSFVIEAIFGIPGMGKLFVTGISDRDYPVILGSTIFFSTVLACLIFLVDLLYGLIDPRIKLAGRKA